MSDNTQPERFRFDFARIERIKGQIDRGEEISAEDVEYVKECIRVIVAVLEPAIKALRVAVREFAQRITQMKAPPASHQVINVTTTRPAVDIARDIHHAMNTHEAIKNRRPAR